MSIQIIVSSEKLQTENCLLEFEHFSAISSGASFSGMSLFGDKKCTEYDTKVLSNTASLQNTGGGGAGFEIRRGGGAVAGTHS